MIRHESLKALTEEAGLGHLFVVGAEITSGRAVFTVLSVDPVDGNAGYLNRDGDSFRTHEVTVAVV